MLSIGARRIAPTPSPVFDAYWQFAAERQDVWLRRVRDEPPPWSADETLRQFKFTNPYRASDRTSQFLIREVIYRGSNEPREVLFRTLLFKFFNSIDTWRYLEQRQELTVDSFSAHGFGERLDELMESRSTVYSAAYIMPPIRSANGRRKHYGHLELLRQMLIDGLAESIQTESSMAGAYSQLLKYEGIGPFLAYQYATDLNYSDFLSFSECEFVQPGPGAVRGIGKCFTSLGEYSMADAIKWTCERQSQEFDKRGIRFEGLYGRPLQYIDCQNLYCEVDKYARVAFPEFTRAGQPRRVKQNFVSHGRLPRPWFPPKWGINDRVIE